MIETLPATTVAGHFVLHNLMSTDPVRAERFYTALFGWRCEAKTVGERTVRPLFAGEHRVGAILPYDGPPDGVSHWMGYVADPAIEATVAQVTTLGGALCMGVTDVGPIGRIASLNDPDGAVILSVAPAYAATLAPSDQMGTVCWNELLADDPVKAVAFYGNLYGWTVEKTVDVGPAGTYTTLLKDGVQVAGVMQRRPQMAPQATWLFYFLVADLQSALSQVERLGGKVKTPAMPIPGIGRFAVCQDPTGAEFALFCR
jgi:predicted enzyme related to lactoylglutathione lyase